MTEESKSCWLLSRGAYSDYAVHAVFSTEEECQRVIDESGRIDGRPSSGDWNAPEECQIITDAGTPLDVLELALYHHDRDRYNVSPRNMQFVTRTDEHHRCVWPWDFGRPEPTVQGSHVTGGEMESYLSAGIHQKSWGLGRIVHVYGTDHEGVRKAFGERKMRALAFLREMGVEYEDDPDDQD